jgi:hypothetical protein
LRASSYTGPPGPDVRRPGVNLANASCRFSEPTDDIYTSGSQTSSALLRLDGVVLSAGELSAWICGYVLPPADNMSRSGRRGAT